MTARSGYENPPLSPLCIVSEGVACAAGEFPLLAGTRGPLFPLGLR